MYAVPLLGRQLTCREIDMRLWCYNANYKATILNKDLTKTISKCSNPFMCKEGKTGSVVDGTELTTAGGTEFQSTFTELQQAFIIELRKMILIRL